MSTASKWNTLCFLEKHSFPTFCSFQKVYQFIFPKENVFEQLKKSQSILKAHAVLFRGVFENELRASIGIYESRSIRQKTWKSFINSINSKRIENSIIDFPWEIMLTLYSSFFRSFALSLQLLYFSILFYHIHTATEYQFLIWLYSTHISIFVWKTKSKSKMMFENGLHRDSRERQRKRDGEWLMVLWLSSSFEGYDIEKIARTKKNHTITSTSNWNWFWARFSLFEFHLSLFKFSCFEFHFEFFFSHTHTQTSRHTHIL